RLLSELLHDRTLGNPFFLTETLKALEQTRAIAFAPEAGRWHWNIDAAKRSGFASNVVELMIASLRKLPRATQAALQLAACVGNTFDLRTLSIICKKSMRKTAEHLLPALRLNTIVPLHEDYKLIGDAAMPSGRVEPTSDANPTYRFHHDHVQQAAYALIDPEHKQADHLSVGQLMQRHADHDERERRLIDIVGHLNEARPLIRDIGERKELARLNLAAGIKSQRSSAYETALSYLRIGQ